MSHVRLAGILRTVGGLVSAAMVIGACGGTRPARTVAPTPDGSIQAEIAREDGRAWSATRPLTWSDFEATPPATVGEGALTAYSLLYGIRCMGATFRYDVSAVFLPRRSWVTPAVLADATGRVRTLRHEQTHFDLTEVHARRLRKFLAGAYDACRSGEPELRAGAERYITAEAAAQRRYDEETRHGLDQARQRSWEADVATWLKDLADLAPAGP